MFKQHFVCFFVIYGILCGATCLSHRSNLDLKTKTDVKNIHFITNNTAICPYSIYLLQVFSLRVKLLKLGTDHSDG